jgi:hypothetical protein
MQVNKLDFPAPLWVLDDFLSPENAARCLNECIELRRVYMPAYVGAGTNNRIDTRIRQNDVVMLDSVFAAERKRSDILSLVDARVGELNPLWHEGYTLFDTINYHTWTESVLSRYGRCNFYGRHQDTIFDPQKKGETERRRLVTLVLYFNTEPEAFTGGDLNLYAGDKMATVKPKHNRAIVFPSFVFHNVNKVSLPDDAPFSAGRFSLNRWMGFR